MQFTPADFNFIAEAMRTKSESSLSRLFTDPESFDALLDDPRLFRAMLDLKGCLAISLRFYFYVLVRHALLREDVKDREVADYVAEVLSQFASQQRWRHSEGEGKPLDYVSDLLESLERMDGEARFEMLAHVGNFSLFLAGFLPRHLTRRMERRAAPGLRFYEEVGRAHFRMAGDHHLARRLDLDSIYLTLGDVFHLIRLGLNQLSEKLVFFESSQAVQDLFREIDGG
jgi:hypothetical protein